MSDQGWCPICGDIGWTEEQGGPRARIAAHESLLASYREYVLADALCPHCGNHGPDHANGCDEYTPRMDRARKFLREVER